MRLPFALTGAAVGLVMVVTGSFLPWLISGQVSRNSYQISGIADRLGIVRDGLADGLIGAWPLLGPVCFLPVIAALLHWWRTAGGLTVVVGLLCASLGGAVLVIASGASVAGIGLEATGPTTMLIGGIGMVAAGSALTTIRPRRVRMGIGGPGERSECGPSVGPPG